MPIGRKFNVSSRMRTGTPPKVEFPVLEEKIKKLLLYL
jgi:hypothetical protein